MTKIILGLVGPLASGKGTIKKYIEEKHQGKDCRFSTILRDVLMRVDVSISRENLQKVSTVLRQTFGEDLLAKAIIKDAKGIEADIVVIDGVRRLADIKYLKEMDNFFLVSIDADSRLRYARLVARGENDGDRNKTYEQFLADHTAEADQEVPIVMSQANFKIQNSGDFADLYKQVEEILQKVQK